MLHQISLAHLPCPAQNQRLATWPILPFRERRLCGSFHIGLDLITLTAKIQLDLITWTQRAKTLFGGQAPLPAKHLEKAVEIADGELNESPGASTNLWQSGCAWLLTILGDMKNPTGLTQSEVGKSAPLGPVECVMGGPAGHPDEISFECVEGLAVSIEPAQQPP